MGVFALVPLPMAQNLTPVHHGILWRSALGRVHSVREKTPDDPLKKCDTFVSQETRSGRAIPICIKMRANSSGTDQTPTSSIKRAVAPHNWPVPSSTSSPHSCPGSLFSFLCCVCNIFNITRVIIIIIIIIITNISVTIIWALMLIIKSFPHERSPPFFLLLFFSSVSHKLGIYKKQRRDMFWSQHITNKHYCLSASKVC